ncbi:MAG: hypothetical protein WCZ18_08715 [Ottowia sp.]|nr:hypothetical protein [Ottowia sp.]
MDTMDDTQPALPADRFVGRERFRERIRQALAEAARARWRELVLSDADFADWPLDEREVVQSLTRWAATGAGTLTLLAVQYDTVQRQFPLLRRWRQQYAHRISCRLVAQEHAGDLPSALWSPAWTLVRYNLRQSSGACGPDPQRRQLLRGWLDDWLDASTPGFPADTLGL